MRATVIFWKDWRSEWRTRAGLNAIALFSVAAPIALSFSVARQTLAPETISGLLWTVLLFAALVGMPRAFAREEESGTARLLRLHFSPDAVFWGKAFFNATLLIITQIAAVPVFMLLLGASVEKPLQLLLALLLGDIGLAVASTLLGAMAAQARARGALFASIAIPILLPLLVAAASATSAALQAPSTSGTYWPAIQIMLAYDVAMTAAAWLLFEFVWNP